MLVNLGNISGLAVPTRDVPPAGRIPPAALAAHRGGRDLYPEGSMVAYRAVAASHPGIVLEMDVRPLKDGTLVVCHDATVDRISVGGVTGRVDAMTPAQWRDLRVKSTGGTMIGPAAFLSDVLDEFGSTDNVLMIELKVYSEAARNRYVEQLWPHRGQVVSACFDAPTARTLALSGFEGQILASTAPAVIPEWARQVAINEANITPTVVSRVHEAGSSIWAWTVNDPARKNELLAMGVDGIITDNPDA